MNNLSSRTPRFIIGLTGAIGTGKSLVRRMLEHKGALTIDADHLAHEAYAKGTKGFNELVKLFGSGILDGNGRIDRQRLGTLVFKDSRALGELEAVIHPLVIQAIERIIELSPLPVIAIEAIKLLESGLHEICDVSWSVASRSEDIYQRLGESRNLDHAKIDERLGQQSVRNADRSLLDAIISNQGSIEDLWVEVSTRWDDLLKSSNSFNKALIPTLKLMKPFERFLVHPGTPSEQQAFSEINKRGFILLPVRKIVALGAQANEVISDIAHLEKNSFQFHVWKSEAAAETSLYIISEMDNFTASAVASASRFDADEFTKMISVPQEYLNLHLCETFFYSFNKESAPLSGKLGFKKPMSENGLTFDLSPLRYNLLCKQLRQPLNLFRE